MWPLFCLGKAMKNLRNLWLLVLAYPGLLRSQGFTGADFSQYLGISSVYANPAWIVATPYAKQAQLGAFGLGFSNNYWALEAPFTPWQWLTGGVDPSLKNAQGKIVWRPEWLTRNNQLQAADLMAQAEVRGPSYAKQLGTRLAWSTQTRTRSYLQIRDTDPALFRWAESVARSQSSSSTASLGSNFHLQSSAWQEWAGTLAAAPVSNGSLRIRLGATAKMYMGLGYAEAKSQGTRMQFFGRDSLTVYNSDMTWTFSSPQALQSITGSIVSGTRPSLGSISGLGLGLDLGAVFEFGRMGDAKWKAVVDGKPSFGANPYRFQLALSVLDFGGLRYGSDLSTIQISNSQAKTLVWDTAVWTALAQGQNALFDELESFARRELNYQNSTESRTVRMPATWVLQGNYRINRWLQLGAQWRHNSAAVGLSSIQLVPRFESKWLELGVPMSLHSGYRDLAAGGFVRLGPLWLGSDRLFSSLFQTSKSDLDVYMGLSWGWKLGSDNAKKAKD